MLLFGLNAYLKKLLSKISRRNLDGQVIMLLYLIRTKTLLSIGEKQTFLAVYLIWKFNLKLVESVDIHACVIGIKYV